MDGVSSQVLAIIGRGIIARDFVSVVISLVNVWFYWICYTSSWLGDNSDGTRSLWMRLFFSERDFL